MIAETETMPHIFVSYSHKDSDYAHDLERALKQRGFEVWIDDRIDLGDKWTRAIQEHLDNCAAFVYLMSPNSYQSDWVHNEVSRATRKNKPIFPMLLQGEPWLVSEATQYIDVTDRSLPTEEFYSKLAQVVPSNGIHDGIYSLEDYQRGYTGKAMLPLAYVKDQVLCQALKQCLFPSLIKDLRSKVDDLAWIHGITDPQQIEQCIQEVLDALEVFEQTRMYFEMQNALTIRRNLSFSWSLDKLPFNDEIDVLFMNQNSVWNVVKFAPLFVDCPYYDLLSEPFENLAEIENIFKMNSIPFQIQLAVQMEAIKQQLFGAQVVTYIYFARVGHVLKVDADASEAVIKSLTGTNKKIESQIDRFQ